MKFKITINKASIDGNVLDVLRNNQEQVELRYSIEETPADIFLISDGSFTRIFDRLASLGMCMPDYSMEVM